MSGNAFRALIVEDTDASRDLEEIVLRAAGFHVTTATTGAMALEVLDHQQFDIILMDLKLPDMDGLEVVRAVRANPRTRRIAIAAVTAKAMRGDRESAMQAGCDGYITKPISTRTFAAAIDSIIATRRQTEGQQ